MKRKVLLTVFMAVALISAVIQISKIVKTNVLLRANIEAMTDDEAGGGPITLNRCYKNEPQVNIGDFFPVCASGTTTYLNPQDVIVGSIYQCTDVYTRPGLLTQHGLCFVQVSQ